MNKVVLSSVIDLISGGTPKTDSSEYWDGNIGWLSVTDFNDDLRYVYESEKSITKLGVENSNTKFLEIGDIIISARGTVGAMSQIGLPMCFNQSCFGIRGKKEIVSTDYLYYAIKNYIENVVKRSQGSVFNTINLASFDLMEIEIHDTIPKQHKVTKILSDLDEKIELNNKINKELETVAKLIYEYWFVQFDFPDTSGKPYKSSGGKMIYNETLKREIPDGWDINSLSDWIGSDKTGDWGKESEQGNYVFQVDCIRGTDLNGLNGKGKIESPNRFILKNNKNKQLTPFDLIVEISGGSPVQSTGRIAYLTVESFERFDHPLICSNFCKAISLTNNNYFYNFVYQWNAIYDNGILFGWEGKTSGIKNLLFDSFVNTYKVCIPPEHIAKKFYSLIKPLELKKQKALKENFELESLRDWLLPMLMNGQISVEDQ